MFKEIKKTAILALPICVGHLGNVLTGVADYTMLGHYDPLEMSATTFATSVFFPIMILGLGFSIGITPLVAKSNGEKNLDKANTLFSTGIKLNGLIGLGLFGLLLVIQQNLHLLNQPIQVVEVCIDYFTLISISIIPLMIFSAFKQYIEGLQDTITPMVISLIANFFNIVLNYFLIFGKGGFPELGIVGAGVSTLLARVLMVLLSVGYFLYRENLRLILKQIFNDIKSFQFAKDIMGIGVPVAIYMFFEVTAFSAATFMMGWISEDHISANQIALSLASLSFVVSMGIGAAGGIRTATYYGEKSLVKIKKVVQSVLAITLSISFIAALVFLIFQDNLPLLFVPATEIVIITEASIMLLYAALFQFSDGLQVVFQGLLQGIGDVKIPSLIAVASYWLVGLPLGYYLAFELDMISAGIWIGLAVGLTVSATLQISRYFYSLKRLKF